MALGPLQPLEEAANSDFEQKASPSWSLRRTSTGSLWLRGLSWARLHTYQWVTQQIFEQRLGTRFCGIPGTEAALPLPPTSALFLCSALQVTPSQGSFSFSPATPSLVLHPRHPLATVAHTGAFFSQV